MRLLLCLCLQEYIYGRSNIFYSLSIWVSERNTPQYLLGIFVILHESVAQLTPNEPWMSWIWIILNTPGLSPVLKWWSPFFSYPIFIILAPFPSNNLQCFWTRGIYFTPNGSPSNEWYHELPVSNVEKICRKFLLI